MKQRKQYAYPWKEGSFEALHDNNRSLMAHLHSELYQAGLNVKRWQAMVPSEHLQERVDKLLGLTVEHARSKHLAYHLISNDGVFLWEFVQAFLVAYAWTTCITPKVITAKEVEDNLMAYGRAEAPEEDLIEYQLAEEMVLVWRNFITKRTANDRLAPLGPVLEDRQQSPGLTIFTSVVLQEYDRSASLDMAALVKSSMPPDIASLALRAQAIWLAPPEANNLRPKVW